MDSDEDTSVKRARIAEKIYTKEQLIQKADELHIDRNWYSFDGDRTKPVTTSGDSVYYEKSGHTICSSTYGVYNCMLEKLLSYKNHYDYIHSDEKYRIMHVHMVYQGDVGSYNKELGKVFVSDGSQTEEGSEQLSKSGWSFVRFDDHDNVYRYEKMCGDEMLQYAVIVFNKKTDEQDRNTFHLTLCDYW